MKEILASAMLFLTVGCKKNILHYNRFDSRDTVNNISFLLKGGSFPLDSPKGISRAEFRFCSRITGYDVPWDVIGAEVSYWETCCEVALNSHTVVDFTQYYLKYLGSVPLIDTSGLQYDDGYDANYYVAASLLGKPIFEARNRSNDSLLQTFYLSPDSATAFFEYHSSERKDTSGKLVRVPPLYLTKDSLTSALLQYISPSNVASSSLYATAYPAK